MNQTTESTLAYAITELCKTLKHIEAMLEPKDTNGKNAQTTLSKYICQLALLLPDPDKKALAAALQESLG